MITGSSPSAMMRPDVVEVQNRGGTYYGLQLTDFCGPTIDQQALWFRVFTPTILTSSTVSVPSNFLGLTVENVGCGNNLSISPTAAGIPTSIHRILGQGTYWAEIETSDNVFNWAKLDAAVNAALADGKQVMWNIAYTPSFHSGNANAKRSSGASTAGWAAAPADIAGSLQTYPTPNSAKWTRFVKTAVQRYAGRIKYYIMGNEPNYRTYATTGASGQANAPCGNWFDSSDTGVLTDLTTVRTSVSGNQNYTQYVQLLADLYGLVHQYDPNGLVLAPEMYGELSSQSSGGKQAGDTTFAAFLAAGGGSYCDGYSWHNYMDEYMGIQGVSLRLNSFLATVEGKVALAGAPTRPWYHTETGHNNLGFLATSDQNLWLIRNMIISAGRGAKCWSMYAWDVTNTSTYQMSLYQQSTGPGAPGLQVIAPIYSRMASLLPGSSLYAVQLNTGRVCFNVNGVPFVA